MQAELWGWGENTTKAPPKCGCWGWGNHPASCRPVCPTARELGKLQVLPEPGCAALGPAHPYRSTPRRLRGMEAAPATFSGQEVSPGLLTATTSRCCGSLLPRTLSSVERGAAAKTTSKESSPPQAPASGVWGGPSPLSPLSSRSAIATPHHTPAFYEATQGRRVDRVPGIASSPLCNLSRSLGAGGQAALSTSQPICWGGT